MAVTIKTQEACEAGLKSLFVIVVVGVAASLPSSLFSLLLPSSLPPEAANQNRQNSPRRLLARASRAGRWRPCLHGEGRSGELTTWLLLFGSFSFFSFFRPDESNRVGSSESAPALSTYSKTKSRARREQRANSPLFPHPFPPRAPLFPALFSRPFTCSRMRGASLTASTTAPCVRREVKRKRREGKNALSLFGFLELVGVEDLFRRPSLALELEPLCFRDANSARKSTACSCLSREPTAPKGHQRGARHRFSTSTSEPCSRRVVEVGDFVEPRRQRRWRTRPSSPARTGSFVSLRASTS